MSKIASPVNSPKQPAATSASVKKAKSPDKTAKVCTEERVSFNHGDVMLVETVVDNGGYFQFALVALRDFESNGKTTRQGETRTASSVDGEKVKFVPPFGLRALWAAGLVKFPSAPADYGSQAQLIEDIKAFIRRYVNIPEAWLGPIAHYILMTWVYDKFTALPYLRFLGEPGTGKTRMEQVAAALCYKAMVMSGNVTGPVLFRTIDLIQGTLVVDEGDFKESAEWSDIVKVLNNGYTPGFPVVRCENSRSFTPQAFRVYGPKIIGTRSRFADHALETRCLTFETKEAALPTHIPMQLPLSFEDEARALRNKLLKWRFDNFARIVADESKVRHLEPRLGQIGASLCAVADDGKTRRRLVAFLTGYSDRQKSNSPIALIAQALANLQGELKASATVGDIANEVNKLAAEQGLEPMTARRVGGILRSLGFETTRKMRGYRVNLDAGKIGALCRRYGVEKPQTLGVPQA